MASLFDLQSSYFSIFLIITIGIIIGKFEYKGISLGLSAVIFVAIVFGHFGITVPDIFQKIGLILFIYSVGIQAGPGFFESFRKQGLQGIALAVIIVVVGGIVSVGAAYLLDIPMDMAAGLFTGALTSTPGLASAIESTNSPLASIGYGIAYPFGVVGVIFFLFLIPRLLHIDMKGEERKYEDETRADYPEIQHKHFIVENPNIIGKKISELRLRSMTSANLSRIKHGNVCLISTPTTRLQRGDIVRLVGTDEALLKAALLIGPTTNEDIPLEGPAVVQWVLVTNKDVVNKSLAQLNLFVTYNATVTRLRRSGIDITPQPSSRIRFGDKLLIACQGNIDAVTTLFGNDDKKLSETDILPLAAGIVLGILIGKLSFTLFENVEISLGLTGGILTSALILSRLGKTGPIIWNVSGGANQLLRHLGLLFFLTAVGTEAGAHLVKTLTEHGLVLFVTGVVVTIIPMFISILIGHYLFKINFIVLLGVLAGGMTSTPGLTAIDSLTKSNAPNIAYATVYPIAMVTVIIITQIMAALM